MVKVQSPASATVINAISIGRGSAYGIKLYVTADVNIISRNSDYDIECICMSLDDPDMDVSLIDECVKLVYERLCECKDFNLKNITLKVETKSDIPPGSGLSSSSAASNSVVYATLLTLLDEAGLTVDDVGISDEDIINIGIEASLNVGVSITGAYDDASASFYGGWKITDNMKREIIADYPHKYSKVLIYIPDKSSYTAQCDVENMKILAPLVEIAFSHALDKNIEKALTLNGLLYSTALNLDTQVALDALKAGAKAAGLSGTGSAYSILVDNQKDIVEIKSALSKYPGRLIETELDNEGSVVIGEDNFE